MLKDDDERTGTTMYRVDPNFDFSEVTKKRPKPPLKRDPLADMLRLAGAAAPAVGAGAGGIIGAGAGGVGALPGAAIGGAVGTGLGGLASYGADMLERDDAEEARRRDDEEEERAAQHRAALQMLGAL